MTAFSKLSLSDLQEQVGPDLLEELGELLPLINSDINPEGLYSSKKLLEKVFISFGGIDRLADNAFRRHVLLRLSGKEIGELHQLLGLPSTSDIDAMIAAIVALGWRTTEVTKTILSALGFDPELAPRPKPIVHCVASLLAAENPYRQLKDYQFELLCEASRRLGIPRSRFVIQMPTGAGKTRTAVELACGQLNISPRTVVWLAHSEELCEQAVLTFQDIWQHVGRVPVDLVRLFGAAEQFSSVNGDRAFVVASFQRLFSVLQAGKFPGFLGTLPEVGLVIVDEAHKVIAPTYKAVTKALLGQESMCVGLTATPGRSAINLDENKELADFFFEKIVTFNSGELAPVQFLRNKGILARADYDPLITSLSFELTDKERKHLEDFFDFPPGLLKRMGANAARNAEIVKRLQHEAKNGSSILFFACSLEHSKFVCSTLNFLGIPAAHVDGATPRERRSHLIDSYRNGSIRVLCNYGVLATGFDAPRTDVVFISRPTASVVLYSQMIGRGLRGPEVGGTDHCKIVDVRDNIEGFSDQNSVYAFFADYWT
jgi:superfamily II DNA or RNA helicase